MLYAVMRVTNRPINGFETNVIGIFSNKKAAKDCMEFWSHDLDEEFGEYCAVKEIEVKDNFSLS